MIERNRILFEENLMVITSDNDALDFLKLCLETECVTRYITQRMHFFIVMDGIAIGGQWLFSENVCSVQWFCGNDLKKHILKSPKPCISYKDYKFKTKFYN